MRDFTAAILNLYAHQLNEPSRSFDTTVTTADFKKELLFTIKDAKVVKYVNPKGEVIVLKDTNDRV